jgi:hypothetical protein
VPKSQFEPHQYHTEAVPKDYASFGQQKREPREYVPKPAAGKHYESSTYGSRKQSPGKTDYVVATSLVDEYDSMLNKDPSKRYDVQFLHHVLENKMVQLVDALKLV